MAIQTVVFRKDHSPSDVNDGDGWTLSTARAWLGDHDFKRGKVDETDSSFRFRQFPPDRCKAGSFKTLTQGFPAGVAAVDCERKESVMSEHKNTSDKEQRTWAASEMRLEKRQDGEGMPDIVGHAAVFNVLSVQMFNFREKIQSGAFRESIQNGDDVRALFNHDSNFVLGRTTSETLEVEEDDRGLAVRIKPPDTTWARDLIETIRRKDVFQMSFGFRTLSDKFEKVDGETIRTLVKAKLFDVSPVTFPAYPQTDVSVRSMLTDEEREILDAEGQLIRPVDADVLVRTHAARIAARRRELDLLELEA